MKKSTKATLGQETPGIRCDNLVKTVSPGVFLKPRLTRRVGSGVEQQATQNWMSHLSLNQGAGQRGKHSVDHTGQPGH